MNKSDIVHLVNEWADRSFKAQLRSALDYPGQTVEGRLMAGTAGVDRRPACSIVPDTYMPRWVVEVDRVIRVMNPLLREWIEWRHLGPGSETEKMAAWCEANAISRTKYKEIGNCAYTAVEQGVRQFQSMRK